MVRGYIFKLKSDFVSSKIKFVAALVQRTPNLRAKKVVIACFSSRSPERYDSAVQYLKRVEAKVEQKWRYNFFP